MTKETNKKEKKNGLNSVNSIKMQNKTKRRNITNDDNKEKGRSMIEILGVLAVIGVLSVAGIAGYQKAMAKHRLNVTMSQMAAIINNMRTVFYNAQSDPAKPYALFGNNKQSSAEGMQKALALNVFPKEMLTGEVLLDPSLGSGYIYEMNQSFVQNVYHGDVYIVSDDGGETFNVIFEGLPKDVAAALSSANWGIEDSTGLQEIVLKGNQKQTAQ